MINYLFSNPLSFIVYFIALLIAIAVHEFSHAVSADYLGDPTPRLQGRLNLNPLVHIDNMGLLFLLLFGFGWGKPVEFDPYNLKHPRRDAAVISISGPLSNLILASILSILLRLFIYFELGYLITIATFIFIPVIQMSIILGVFNLLPILPLECFNIVGGFLSEQNARDWYGLQKYGIFFLLLMILPIGGASMLTRILIPIVSFFNNLLLPFNVAGGIV